MSVVRSTRGSRFPSRTLRKVLITALVGAATYVLTELAVGESGDSEQEWGLLMAIFMGGVAFVVQFLSEVDDQLEAVRQEQRDHYESVHRLVAEGFSGINEVTRLFGLVEASALPAETVTRFVQHAAMVSGDIPELVKAFALGEVDRTSRLLRELAEGHVIYEGEDRDWLLRLTSSVRSRIDAISVPSVDARYAEFDEGFWMTDLGQRYMKCQHERIQSREVHIRRIFLVDCSQDLESPAFRRVVRMQAQIGIEVRVLLPDDIPPMLRGSVFDFIVFDEAISYETLPSQRTGEDMAPMIKSTILRLEADQVRERIAQFQELWKVARRLEQLEQITP